MTQNILKRLKESIDRGGVIVSAGGAGVGATTTQSSVLPSQISDAYLTTQSKRIGSSSQQQQQQKQQQPLLNQTAHTAAAALMHVSQANSANSGSGANNSTTVGDRGGQLQLQQATKLSTILEQNSNQKLIKSFFTQAQTKAHVKTSLTSSKKAISMDASCAPPDTRNGNLHASRKARSKDSTNLYPHQQQYQQHQQQQQQQQLSSNTRQSISPQAPPTKSNKFQAQQLQQLQQINSNNILLHDKNNGKVKVEKKRASAAIIYQTAVSGGRTANVASINPYSTANTMSDHNNNNQSFENQRFARNSGEQQSSSTVRPNNKIMQFLTSTSGQVSVPQSQVNKTTVVKKANITASTENNTSLSATASAKQKVTTKQTPTINSNEQHINVSGSVDLTQGGNHLKVSRFTTSSKPSAASTTTKQAKNIEMRGSQDYSTHQVTTKMSAALNKQAAAILSANNLVVSQILSKQQQQPQHSQKTTAGPIGGGRQSTQQQRKAKTTYSRTPASYRSVSGGSKPPQFIPGQKVSCSPDTMNQKQGSTTMAHTITAPSSTGVNNNNKKSQRQQQQAFAPVQQIGKPKMTISQGGKAANSLGSLQQNNVLAAATTTSKPGVTTGGQAGGNHKRSVSFKPSKNTSNAAIQLTSQMMLGGQHGITKSGTTNVQTALIQQPSNHIATSQVNQKVKFNINYEQMMLKKSSANHHHHHNNNNINNGAKKVVVSPFRTKQPSVNNSRRYSKEHNSQVHSPRTTKNTIGATIKVGNNNKQGKVKSTGGNNNNDTQQQVQQSSFLSKANSKSLNSSSMLQQSHNNNATTNRSQVSSDMQKLLKNFIKQVAKNQQTTNQPQQPSQQQQKKDVAMIPYHGAPAAPTQLNQNHNTKSKHQRTAINNQKLLKQVLGAGGKGDGEKTTSTEGQYSTSKLVYPSEERTFQERLAEGIQMVGQQSYQNASANFAPENHESQMQIVNDDIISGAFIATKSNEKMKVYQEEVKEMVLNHMPQRTRISRIPTKSQLQASSFENQVTMKPGDKVDLFQQSHTNDDEPVEQVSVLDGSFQVSHTQRSQNGSIFQAFDEYTQKPVGAKIGAATKQIHPGGIRQFNENIMGPVIDFHPQNSRIGDVEQNSDNSAAAGLDSGEQTKQKMVNQMLQGKVEVDTGGEGESEEYSSEIEITEVFDPLLEDKQYLVTMIVTHFQEMGQPIGTTHEFYRVGNKIGEGAFGKVCVAQHKLSGHFVAIKCLRKKELNKQIECKKKVAQDMQILQHLTHHKNVVKLYDSFETNSHLCFVMELCAGGDLLSFVRRRKKLDETQAKFLFKQVAKGLAYCHRNRVLHRDIKLENLLLDDEGTVKICDFGVSQLLNQAADLVKDQCGTPAYMAPEVFKCTEDFSGQQADVWSLGICLYAMLCGMVPFKGHGIRELQKCIIEGPLKYPKDIKSKLTREARHLIKRMLVKDPTKRITMAQVLRHPWMHICPKRMSVFSAPELKKIRVLQQPANGGDEPQRLLTEVEMTMQSLSDTQKALNEENGQYSLDYGYKVKNVSDRSFVLAPFNSTITQKGFDRLLDDAPVEDERIIKFNDRVREANRQYEFNYNGEVDNGIMISVNADEKTTSDKGKQKDNPKANEQPNPENQPSNPEPPQVSHASSVSKQGAKNQKSAPPETQAPQISQASLATDQDQLAEKKEAEEEIVMQPVINFNGLSQVGYMEPSEQLKATTLKSEDKSHASPDCQQNKANNEAAGSVNTEEDSVGSADVLDSQWLKVHANETSYEPSDDEEQIDNLIVCKIENEFGYPEHYLLDCLKNDRKNDATTCYYLFCKEDKHEIVNLLTESPIVAAAQGKTSSQRNNIQKQD